MNVLAYLDAGSASVMVSAVAAGVGGAAVAMRGALGKFKRPGKKSELVTAADTEVEAETEIATDAETEA
jgi:hypothetical protein